MIKPNTTGCEIHLVPAVASISVNDTEMRREDHLSRDARRRLAGDVDSGSCILDNTEEKWAHGVKEASVAVVCALPVKVKSEKIVTTGLVLKK